MIYIVHEFPWGLIQDFEGTLDYTILSDEEGNKSWDNAQDFFALEDIMDCVILGAELNEDLNNHGVGERMIWNGMVMFSKHDSFLIPRGKMKHRGYVWALVSQGL